MAICLKRLGQALIGPFLVRIPVDPPPTSLRSPGHCHSVVNRSMMASRSWDSAAFRALANSAFAAPSRFSARKALARYARRRQSISAQSCFSSDAWSVAQSLAPAWHSARSMGTGWLVRRLAGSDRIHALAASGDDRLSIHLATS